jgi:hypothetical protein
VIRTHNSFTTSTYLSTEHFVAAHPRASNHVVLLLTMLIPFGAMYCMVIIASTFFIDQQIFSDDKFFFDAMVSSHHGASYFYSLAGHRSNTTAQHQLR